jgi:hypothetical protein
MAGLIDRPKSGRPPAADEPKKKLVLQARAAGQTVYEHALLENDKPGTDSIVSRLNELTGDNLPCFEPSLQPAQFFGQSWAVRLLQRGPCCISRGVMGKSDG